MYCMDHTNVSHYVRINTLLVEEIVQQCLGRTVGLDVISEMSGTGFLEQQATQEEASEYWNSNLEVPFTWELLRITADEHGSWGDDQAAMDDEPPPYDQPMEQAPSYF